jgi:glutamate-1-semialdehyde 2,1-aminomutase
MDDGRPTRPNSRRYDASTNFLERAERVIPLGSQTFSKSKTQLPIGAAPLFVERGEGPYVFDLDGNRYIDFVCSLGAITMGHGDADVMAAVQKQLQAGVVFSLAHPLETYVAEKIVDMIPCAEKVRFGKNGSDATAGCIRVARGFTRRDRIAMCGYHGWQDWCIGSTARDLGIPKATKDLTHTFPYDDLDALKKLLDSHPGEFAAVIMEPVAFTNPQPGYHAAVMELAHKHGALFVFDEVVTGFRFKEGSSQARFGVTPDLCALGKGMANGFPISVVAGRDEVMRLMEEVFFSFTMGGETISLAAADAVLTKIKTHKTLDTIATNGTRLLEGFRARIAKHGLSDVIACNGDPSWSVISIKDLPGLSQWELKTLWIQETARRGVLNIGIHFIGASHTAAVIDEALAVYDEVLGVLKQAVDAGSVNGMLECEPLKPLFRVRT